MSVAVSRSMKSILNPCLLLSASCCLLACGSSDPVEDEQPCIAVVQYARPAAGGECKMFSSPCDVPAGYLVCCGGFTSRACLGQAQCVDDPTDTCNAESGGADCPGICQP